MPFNIMNNQTVLGAFSTRTVNSSMPSVAKSNLTILMKFHRQKQSYRRYSFKHFSNHS